MSLFASFKTNTNLEKTGILLNYGKTADGRNINIRVARSGGSNTAYAKRMEVAARPHRRAMQTETIDAQLLVELVRKVFCETVVLGWENVEDEEGNPIEFSPKAAEELFIKLPDLYADVSESAGRAALFREAIREADSGN